MGSTRCGILHEQTPESKASRKGYAVLITYDLPNGRSLVQTIPGTQSLKINPGNLAKKWAAGVKRFLQDVTKDASRHQEFIDRAESLVIQQQTSSPKFTSPP